MDRTGKTTAGTYCRQVYYNRVGMCRIEQDARSWSQYTPVGEKLPGFCYSTGAVFVNSFRAHSHQIKSASISFYQLLIRSKIGK
jgi:hypothetical protein